MSHLMEIEVEYQAQWWENKTTIIWAFPHEFLIKIDVISGVY